MALGHKLAGMLCAAILIVALQLVPSTAFAHAGHAHGSPGVNSIISSEIEPVDTAQADKRRSEVSVYSADLNRFGTGTTGGCTGGCCSSPGLGCCGGAIAVPLQDLPDLASVPPPPMLKIAPVSGVDPDALIKPPKVLA